MVHAFCVDKGCRTILHLDGSIYWNYKGIVKCQKCGATIEIEIKDGQVVSTKKVG